MRLEVKERHLKSVAREVEARVGLVPEMMTVDSLIEVIDIYLNSKMVIKLESEQLFLKSAKRVLEMIRDSEVTHEQI